MSAPPKQPRGTTAEADEAARKRDPHGVSPAGDAASETTPAVPNDDRHQGETAAGG